MLLSEQEVLERAKNIRLLAMDVDGCLTAGEVILLNNGEEIKIWSVKDRMGFYMLKVSELPVKLAWITARESLQVQQRAEEIGIHYLFQKTIDKWQKLEDCSRQLGLKPEQVAFIGDDMVDLRCLSRVGLAACPPDSADPVKAVCHYQIKTPGGKGAIREMIELVIKAQGAWDKVVKVFAAGLILFCAGLTGCSSKMPQRDLSESPDQWIEKFTITETSSGLPVWVLNSGSAEIYNKQKRALLNEISIQFMKASKNKRDTNTTLGEAKKQQTQAARLSAPKGEVKLDSHDLSAWGGVEVHSDDGTVLYTEQLMFSSSQQKILSQSPVKIVRNDSIVIGEGLEATPDLSEVKIFRHEASISPRKIKLK
jgi:3-deoxy-D-manno-octulosonate 8-phosphate phosphatase (KDO 8-P phosphatase)